MERAPGVVANVQDVDTLPWLVDPVDDAVDVRLASKEKMAKFWVFGSLWISSSLRLSVAVMSLVNHLSAAVEESAPI